MTNESLNNFHNINLSEFEIAFKDHPIIIRKPGEPLIKKENHFDESFKLLINKLVEILRQSAKEMKIKENADIYSTKSDEIIPRVSFNTLTNGINISIGLMRDYYKNIKL